MTKRSIRTLIAGAVALASLSALPGRAIAATTVWNAQQLNGQPATFYWAVILGATDYAGSTGDAPGGAEDAYSLRDHLLSLGWRSDHIFMATNLSMTRANVISAIRWLASKTNNRSLAIFHYSGHEMPFHSTSDGDNEARDVSLWTADNRYVYDGELGRELSRVHAIKMWIDIASCRASGFSDAGTTGPGRVVTYSSPESELSYSDNGLKHSIFNYFEIVQGMRNKIADRNKDGKVSVEEAFWYSRSLTTDRTAGKQHPMINDQVGGDLQIAPPR